MGKRQFTSQAEGIEGLRSVSYKLLETKWGSLAAYDNKLKLMFSDKISAKNKTVGEILVIRVPLYT